MMLRVLGATCAAVMGLLLPNNAVADSHQVVSIDFKVGFYHISKDPNDPFDGFFIPEKMEGTKKVNFQPCGETEDLRWVDEQDVEKDFFGRCPEGTPGIYASRIDRFLENGIGASILDTNGQALGFVTAFTYADNSVDGIAGFLAVDAEADTDSASQVNYFSADALTATFDESGNLEFVSTMAPSIEKAATIERNFDWESLNAMSAPATLPIPEGLNARTVTPQGWDPSAGVGMVFMQ